MAIEGVYGRTLMRHFRGVTKVLPVQESRNRSTWTQCSIHDSATYKRAPDPVIPFLCLPFHSYNSYLPPACCKKKILQNESQFQQLANKTSCVTNIRYGLTLQSIQSSLTTAVSSEFSKINFNRSALFRRSHKFGVLSGQLPWEPSTHLLNQVAAGSLSLPSGIAPSIRHVSQGKNGFTHIHNRITSLQAKKRTQRKKKQPLAESEEAQETVAGFAPGARHKFLTFDPDFTLPEMYLHRPPPREWQVTAYATADEYNLDKLLDGLIHQGLYTAARIAPCNLSSQQGIHSTSSGSDSGSRAQAHSGSGSNSVSPSVPDAHDVLHVIATYQLESEQRQIYFFREGSVVFWNVAELERTNVLRFLKKFEEGKHDEQVVEEENESLTYRYSDGPSKTRLVRDKIFFNPEGQTYLEKYTFSNAMAMSVKLGIWEASLDKYIDNIEFVSEELSKTGKVVLSQNQVLQHMGQLFALRHLINLSSDLLDIPDFYWEHEELEQLYRRVSNHLNVSKRTSVMNVKLSHCVELMELLKSHLNEEHSSRLEWIIIILIMVEVGFELLHFMERLF